MSHESHLPSQLLAVLDQGRSLIDSLDAETYARIPAPIASSPIGAHMRHVLDAVQCFARGAGAEIDYDHRERNEAIESEPGAALARLGELMGAITSLELDLARTVRVRSDVPVHEDLPGDGWVDSTVEREILYVLSHTIHHYALIAMILRHLGQEPVDGFGVAPSTLRHWREVGRCAPLVG